jgi:hypothetical protein
MNGVSTQPVSSRSLADISIGTSLDWLSYVEEDYSNDVTLQTEVERLLSEEMGRIPYDPERYLIHLPHVPKSTFEVSLKSPCLPPFFSSFSIRWSSY